MRSVGIEKENQLALKTNKRGLLSCDRMIRPRQCGLCVTHSLICDGVVGRKRVSSKSKLFRSSFHVSLAFILSQSLERVFAFVALRRATAQHNDKRAKLKWFSFNIVASNTTKDEESNDRSNKKRHKSMKLKMCWSLCLLRDCEFSRWSLRCANGRKNEKKTQNWFANVQVECAMWIRNSRVDPRSILNWIAMMYAAMCCLWICM